MNEPHCPHHVGRTRTGDDERVVHVIACEGEHDDREKNEPVGNPHRQFPHVSAHGIARSIGCSGFRPGMCSHTHWRLLSNELALRRSGTLAHWLRAQRRPGKDQTNEWCGGFRQGARGPRWASSTEPPHRRPSALSRLAGPRSTSSVLRIDNS